MGSRFPSIAMREARRDIYLVLDDFGGRLGRAWRETDEEASTREMLIRDLLDGLYHNPACIVAFNAAEGWSRECGRHAPRGGISPWSTWWAYCAMSRASVTTAAIALFPARSA